MNEKLQAFLEELTELSHKYHMYIQGCGCCGSPWIYDDIEKKEYDELYMNSQGEYTIDDMKGSE